ncbi:MAG: ABC transporter ATP-binding protein [Clostridiales bacterium]|jgi:oligopeptide/dipeptide ABC transporter ATP-binding protein|nr:ABC transporter ATP-binding protein [Clostridiales bacterium]
MMLEVRDLRVTFKMQADEVQAVRGVSWHLDDQETIAIVGESGCGKTASIQTVMGLHAGSRNCVKSGEAIYKGENLLEKTEKEMRSVQGKEMSIIFQDPFTYLNPTMTVGRQITEVYCRHTKASRSEATQKTLEIMRMISMPTPEQSLKCYPHQLSGGMRQRVVIAMALVCKPKILFADEPTTALDVTIQAQIIELIKDLKKKTAMSIALITHDLGVVANMADRVYVMYAGKIVEHGTARDIFKDPRHPYTAGLLGSVPRLDIRSSGSLYSIPGTPPDLLAPPPGCAFAARCPKAMKICARKEPGFTEFGNGHRSSCWL